MKRKTYFIISSLLFGACVVIGSIFAISSHERYRDIRETILEGEAYGFSIGADQETVFWQIADMAAQEQVHWITVYKGQEFRIHEVVEEFADWESWDILSPEGQEIYLNFIDQSLDLFYEFHGYGVAIQPLSSWPQTKASVPQIQPGMSYTEVYQTLLELSAFQKFQNIRIRPEGYKQITQFTEENLQRLKKQNAWHVKLYPFPYGEDQNYVFFRFEQGSLVEIYRRKDAPDLLDDIIDIFLGIFRKSNRRQNT